MANYRPKSLDELGNLYDKSLEAENEIKKSSSKLEDKPVQPISAFLPDEDALPMKKTPQQVASDEIAGKVEDFAKSFGSGSETCKNPIVIPTVQSKPRPPRKKADEAFEQGTKGKSKKAVSAEPAKPKLIRDPERTSLFENYKKVMDDEDDYNFSEPEDNVKRRLRRNKGAAKAEKTVQQENVTDDGIALQAEAAVDSVFETGEKASDPAEEKSPFKKISYEEYKGEAVESTLSPEISDGEERQRKNPGVQIALMVILLCVLVSSLGIGCIKAFSGADSDRVVFGNNYVYTVKRSYADSAVKKGDLVITENKAPSAGDIVAYKQDTGAYAFARYESALNLESAIANDGVEQILIFNSEMRGVVVKTIPVAGLFVSAVVSYFLPIMGLMLLLAALLVLLIFFISRDTVASDDEEENDDEDYGDDETQAEASDETVEEEEAETIDDEIESLFTL